MSDLISKQTVINRINKQREYLKPALFEQDDIADMTYRICAEFISLLPSAEQHGKWINCGWSIKCSICDYDMPFSVRNYCPNCGSRMDLEENEDE